MYDTDIQEKTLINIGYEPVKLKPSEVKILQNRLYKIVYAADNSALNRIINHKLIK